MKLDALQIELLEVHAKEPTRAHRDDAGLDLHALEDFVIPGGPEPVPIRTGIAVHIPAGHVGLILDRSSMGKRGIKVYGGVIDSGYHGEIIVMLGSPNHLLGSAGDKIAQMVVVPLSRFVDVEVVPHLETTERGSKGFGSSGA